MDQGEAFEKFVAFTVNDFTGQKLWPWWSSQKKFVNFTLEWPWYFQLAIGIFSQFALSHTRFTGNLSFYRVASRRVFRCVCSRSALDQHIELHACFHVDRVITTASVNAHTHTTGAYRRWHRWVDMSKHEKTTTNHCKGPGNNFMLQKSIARRWQNFFSSGESGVLTRFLLCTRMYSKFLSGTIASDNKTGPFCARRKIARK